MMRLRRPATIGIIICLYCAWQSLGLIQAWMKSPYDRLGWLAFTIWCLPVLIFWFRQRQNPNPSPQGNPLFMGLGLISVFIGSAGSLHALEYIGLSFAIAGLIPFSWVDILWVGSALSWMPAFGWLSGRFFPECAHIVRILVAIIPTGILVYWRFHPHSHTKYGEGSKPSP